MLKAMMAATAAGALLAGCSGGKKAEPEEVAAASLNPGEYEVSGKIDSLSSTDGTTPATKAKLGDPPVLVRACVAANGVIDPPMFAEAGDSCKIENAYARGGKLNLQLSCTRPGAPGQVMQTVDGNFKADSFLATVVTGTYFTGSGDYAMKRTVTGKRVGDCPPATEEKKAA